MKNAPLRQLYPLEALLHEEMIAALDNCLTDEGLNEDGTASKKLVDLATKTARFFEKIGFVLTNTGVMARIDQDILDEYPAGVHVVLAAGWERAQTAMHRGPSIR